MSKKRGATVAACLVLLFGAAALVPSLTARADEPGPSPAQIALARATCTEVMRIKEGFVPFQACVESLSHSLTIGTQGQPMAQTTSLAKYSSEPGVEKTFFRSTNHERRIKEEYSCARLGFAPETAGFSFCVGQLGIALQNAASLD